MSSRFRIQLSVASIVLLVISGCGGRLSGKESDLTYDQATDEITDVAERSLAIALGDDLHLSEKSSRQRTCDDAFGGPGDFVYPVVDYKFPMALLHGDADSFVRAVEDLWRANELEVTPSESSRTTKRFGVSSEGFSFQLTVNRESDIIYVGGAGPCVAPPQE